MIALLPIIFEMNFVEVWQSSQTHALFSYSEKTTRSFVDEPKCNNKFLTMVTQMTSSKFSSSSTSSRTNLLQGMYGRHELLCSSAHEFQSSGGGRDHLLQMYAPHYSLSIQVQPGYNFFAPFSIEPCCSRYSQRCLLPAAA
jgi:hypothetical protein